MGKHKIVEGLKEAIEFTRRRTTLLNECLQSQKAAGFPEQDRRKVKCQDCGAFGCNSGWGYWRFECGAESLADGTPDKPCGH